MLARRSLIAMIEVGMYSSEGLVERSGGDPLLGFFLDDVIYQLIRRS